MNHPPRICPRTLLLVAALALGAAGCKTRLYDLGYVDNNDLAARDGAIDFSQPLFDLTIPRDNCGDYFIVTTTIIRPDLLLVQDKSGSMTQGVHGERNPPAGQSKFDLVRSAIEQVVTGTTYVDWGLMLFGTNRGCTAPTRPDVPVGQGTAATIKQVLDNTVPNSSTPTAQTIRNALDYFQGVNDMHPHYILVATDGQPTCAGGNGTADDSAATIQAVTIAAAAGVDTFVVGIGANTGANMTLTAMAAAGRVPNTTPGQPAYYPVTNSQDLVTVLQKAALQITPCAYPLDHVPPALDRVLIQSNAGVIPRDPMHVDGWDYGANDASIVFYGPACDILRSGVITQVESVFGCPGDMA